MEILNRSKSFPAFVQFAMLFQIFTNIIVQLDVPYVRQIVGFIYLTFVPGFVVLKAFKLAKGDFYETLLFSVGLNIVLLMFIGLFLNWLLPIVGLASPLSTLPLLVTMNFVVLLSCLWYCIKDTNIPSNNLALSYHLPLLFTIPLLGILGALVVNSFGNNFLLLLMLMIIAGFVALGIVYKKILPTKFYPLAILAISVALVFHTSLITSYIVGWDYHSEYHVFQLTNNAAHWNSTFNSWDDRIATGNSMLSVTILPTTYSKIANMDGTWLLKILYPLLLSLLPLALYKIYSAQMKKEVAFLATFFLVSNLAFFGIEGFSAKQIIGEYFYVLLFLVILKEKRNTFEKSLFFVLFSAGLVVSHYSMSYIFLFLILTSWLLLTIMHFLNIRVRTTLRITLNMILIFFTISFAWYIFTSSSTPFNAILKVGEQISENFQADFFNPSARTTTVLRGLGEGQTISFGHQIGQIIFYITEFFIVVGIVKMLFKKEHMNLSKEYALLSVLNLGILMMCIIIPNFARYFRAERFYEISLLFLAPFCVFGGESIFQFISRRKNSTLALNLILIFLIPFFLFETGFIYEITEDFNYSLPLSMYRMDRILLYRRITDGREVTAACWLSNYMSSSHFLVYGDFISTSHVLTSYGMMSAEDFRQLSNTTQFRSSNNYIYLRGVNVIEGKIEGISNSWNTSDISPVIDSQNIVYSNGYCEILFTTTTSPTNP